MTIQNGKIMMRRSKLLKQTNKEINEIRRKIEKIKLVKDERKAF